MYSPFFHEKAVLKVAALFAHSQSKLGIDDSEHCLQLFQRNKKEFLRRYVTMDETWIQPFTPESNQPSAEWTAACKSHPKQPKTQTSAYKVWASVFWDAQGTLFIDYLEKGRTINSKYHIALLVRLKGESTKKTATNEDEKSALSPRQCTVSQIDCNDGTHTILVICPLLPATRLFADLSRILQGNIWLQ